MIRKITMVIVVMEVCITHLIIRLIQLENGKTYKIMYKAYS